MYLATVSTASHQRTSRYDQNCIISSAFHLYLTIFIIFSLFQLVSYCFSHYIISEIRISQLFQQQPASASQHMTKIVLSRRYLAILSLYFIILSHYFSRFYFTSHFYCTLTYLATVSTALHQRISRYDQNYIISSVTHLSHYLSHYFLTMMYHFFLLFSHYHCTLTYLATVSTAPHQRTSTYDQNCITSSVSLLSHYV